MALFSESWRNNLAFMFVAEFVAIMAFNFAASFQPLFIQKLGGFDNMEAAFWTGLASGGCGIAMFLSAPVWGVVADRWGRKPMVLRALFGAAVLSVLMGSVSNVYVFVALRFLQGLVAGIVAAASALVGADTPRDKIPLAMGLLMLAIFSGSSTGPFLGGFLSDRIGFEATFYATGGLQLVAGLLVLIFIRERFQRPAPGKETAFRHVWHTAASREMMPLLIAICLLNISQPMIAPNIALFVRELDPTTAAATTAGIALSLMGIVTAVSSIVSSRLGKRVSLKKLMIVSSIGTGLLFLPPIWAGSVSQLLVFIALAGLFYGSLLMSSSSLVGLSVPQSRQGIAYGLSTSAQSLGSGLGPIIGGSLVSWLGFRPVFGIAGLLLILVGLLLARLLGRKPAGET
jgi:DHA1 family multidrug resistance protein-like MFS transporter